MKPMKPHRRRGADRRRGATRRLASFAALATILAAVPGLAPARPAPATAAVGPAVPVLAQVNPCTSRPAFQPEWFSPCWDYTGRFADPNIVRDGATYYAYGTIAGGAHLPIATSSSPTGPWRPRPAWSPKPTGLPIANTDPFFNDGLVRPPQWAANDASPGHPWLRQEVWAPTVAKFGSTWVAYYAVRLHPRSWDSPWDADGAPGYFGNGRFCISYATAPSPTGPFRDDTTAPLTCGEDLDAHLYGGRYGGDGERANPAGVLDPSIFVDPATGIPYLLYKTEGKRTDDLPGEQGHPTEIVIRRLDADGTGFAPGAAPVRIAATAEGSWEGMVIENPAMVFFGGRYLLITSGGEWTLGMDQNAERRAYGLGYRVCQGPTGGCTAGPAAPLLRTDPARGEYGPGGGNAFTDAAGNLWVSYHFWDTPTPDPVTSVRRLRTVQISDCGAIGRDIAVTCRLVRAAHSDFLGRAATTDEVGFWANVLGAGVPVYRFLEALATSDQWLGATVDRMYVDTLGRPGDGDGRAYWVRALQTGSLDVARTAALFYGSDEYFARYGGGDLGTWVTDLYRKLLLREPEPGGLAYWVQRARTVGRDSVALDFYQSAETREVRVRRLYQQLLGRDPDTGGLVHWREQILTRGDVTLAVDLATSDEYRNRAAARFP
jgi:hypothetical protein